MINIAPRIYFIVARKKNVAAVFRRGPSKWTQILKWDLDRDQMEAGQWFKGRIYERCSDISPNGQLLVYKASKYTLRQSASSYTNCWIAVSKLPKLTARTLWPQEHTWGGGGIFVSDKELYIDGSLRHHPQHPPQGLSVSNASTSPNQGAILSKLGLRGWQRSNCKIPALKGVSRLALDQKELRRSYHLIWARHGKGSEAITEFFIGHKDHYLPLPADTQWADVDHKGRLILAVGSWLYATKNFENINLKKARKIADLNQYQPPE